jgi:hypothetical protein
MYFVGIKGYGTHFKKSDAIQDPKQRGLNSINPSELSGSLLSFSSLRAF